MEDEKSIPPTICRDCVFCEYELDTQIGCKFHDRLFKFEENGADLLGQDDGVNRYFKIVGRFCNACHNKASLQQIPKRKWKTYVEDRVAIQVDYIVQISGGNNVLEMAETLRSIERQNPPPLSLIVNFPADYPNVGQAISDLIDLFTELRLKIKWRIEQLTFDKLIKSCKGIHYIYIEAGQVLPNNYANRINELVNYDMERIIAIIPSKACNALFIQRKGVPGLEKVLEADYSKHFVKVWEDING